MSSFTIHSVTSTSITVRARSHQSTVAVLSHYGRCAGAKRWSFRRTEWYHRLQYSGRPYVSLVSVYASIMRPSLSELQGIHLCLMLLALASALSATCRRLTRKRKGAWSPKLTGVTRVPVLTSKSQRSSLPGRWVMQGPKMCHILWLVDFVDGWYALMELQFEKRWRCCDCYSFRCWLISHLFW